MLLGQKKIKHNLCDYRLFFEEQNTVEDNVRLYKYFMNWPLLVCGQPGVKMHICKIGVNSAARKNCKSNFLSP